MPPMNRAGAILAALGLAVLASCTGSEAATTEAAPVAAPEPVSDAAPIAAPAPQSAPAPETASAIPPGFSYSGELTQGGFIRGVAPANTASAMLGEQQLALAEDRSFFAAFDRDSPANISLTARLENGRTVTETIPVSPREWQIQRVNAALRPRSNPEAWWKIREPEYNAIVAARAQETGARGWTQDFVWPVTGRISGLFGRQRIYRGEPGSYHSGIDIAPGNGVPFVAPADGVVVLARTGFSLEGGLIIIDHGAGLNSAFLHASRIVVEEGQSVTQGQHIGNVGASGRATGPHLHWSLKWNEARLDPLLFTGPMD